LTVPSTVPPFWAAMSTITLPEHDVDPFAQRLRDRTGRLFIGSVIKDDGCTITMQSAHGGDADAARSAGHPHRAVIERRRLISCGE
jgi:hypothetical protein